LACAFAGFSLSFLDVPSVNHREQVLLARRLALAAIVSFTPQQSLYLPLLLFLIVQLSALLQHLTKPYRSHWLNSGEVVSLYLLLANYIATTLSQSAISAGSAQPSDGSAVFIALFLCNTIFLCILVLSLFALLRKMLSDRAGQIKAKLRRIVACCFETDVASDLPELSHSKAESPAAEHSLTAPILTHSVSPLRSSSSRDRLAGDSAGVALARQSSRGGNRVESML
jgi:hypothetical protein